MNFNFGLDYQFIDNLEPITYYVRTTEALPTIGGVNVANCLRVTTTGNQSQSFGLMEKHNTQWHIWDNELGSIVPKIGDFFADSSGNKWAILDVNHTFLTGQWTLATVRMVVSSTPTAGIMLDFSNSDNAIYTSLGI
jgi:hypothetical protein